MADLTGAVWRKSSRSGNGQGSCVEVALNLVGADWRKSTRSANGNGQCVEVARNLPGVVGLRDSKDPNGPAFALAPHTWAAFLDGVKGGDFDL
jgi:uncharacterized protein DUF397